MYFFFYLMKKNDLFSDTGSKRITVFQNVGLQFGDVLTFQMVYHHEMQPTPFGMMPGSVEKVTLPSVISELERAHKWNILLIAFVSGLSEWQ